MLLNDVLLALPKLSNADLKVVKALTEKLLEPETLEGPEQELFHIVIDMLGVKTNWTKFNKSTSFAGWPRGAATALAFAQGTFAGTKSKPLRMAIYGLLAGLVVADLKAQRVPVTLGSVTSNLGRTPMLFEDAYPGYVKAGLSNLLLSKLVRTQS